MKRVGRAYSKTVSIISETPLQIYKSYVGENMGFMLESHDEDEGDFSFIGKNPAELIQSEGNSLVIWKRDTDEYIKIQGNPMDILCDYYNEFEIRSDGVALPFTGGLLGALGYDFVRYKEELPDNNPDEIGIETIQLMMAKEYLIVDHVGETLTAVVIAEDHEESKKKAQAKLEKMLQEAFANIQEEESAFVPDGKIIAASDSMEEYCDKVNKIKKYIVDGHVFQTVLSQRWTVETKQDGFRLYQELRELNPSPYMYYFNFEDFEIIGSSPEMIVKHQDRKVFTCPIAGTRPRGKNPVEDQNLAESLLADEKERAEHVMLVDLARNDMGKISQFGTVKVKDFMHIQRYSHVMHLVSYVEGRKKEEYQPTDLINAFLPAGTLSGAPKVRAMEIIDELENVRRGLYGGAIGYMDFNGNLDFCITIRTMIKKHNKVYLQAGAGIVADSDPVSEYNECRNKAMALAKVLVKEAK